jgi:hypothetical protein
MTEVDRLRRERAEEERRWARGKAEFARAEFNYNCALILFIATTVTAAVMRLGPPEWTVPCVVALSVFAALTLGVLYRLIRGK